MAEASIQTYVIVILVSLTFACLIMSLRSNRLHHVLPRQKFRMTTSFVYGLFGFLLLIIGFLFAYFGVVGMMFTDVSINYFHLSTPDLSSIDSESAFRSVSVDGKKFNELKYSEWEVKSIEDLFSKANNNGSEIGYFHSSATEDSFKKNIRNYNIIHIATHSFVNESRPELSAIVFAQPKDSNSHEDGILYADETYNLDLNANLVVLSSCESGLGKLIKGEGMMALTRGFLYAGASNIIFSLWKIPDKQTSELMIDFYKQMLSGKSYSESLRQAKLKLISIPSSARPRSWASFLLIGKD